MRHLAQELGVVPMALYKHVANKEDLLDGMVENIVGEIAPEAAGPEWKHAVRQQILAARRALLAHQWAREVIESRTKMTPNVLAYIDTMIGKLLAGGLSIDLIHHAMHALDGRMWGFTQTLFEGPKPSEDPAELAIALHDMSERYPNVIAVVRAASHDDISAVGTGCDDQFEFEFALDLLLDGIERLHLDGWSSRR